MSNEPRQDGTSRTDSSEERERLAKDLKRFIPIEMTYTEHKSLVEGLVDVILQREAGLREDLKVRDGIEASFWKARKLLNLPSVTVEDPGQDITDYIASLEAQVKKLREQLITSNGCMKLIFNFGCQKGSEPLGEVIDKNTVILASPQEPSA